MSSGPGQRERRQAIAICVPVRNEAERLSRLFRSLDRLETAQDHRIHVSLLLDGCTDASAAIASTYRQTSAHHVHLAEASAGEPNAGRARGRVMALGSQALSDDEGILLTTDADSWPQPNWLRAMVSALDHADVVAGDVVRTGRRPSGQQDRLDRYYGALYALRRRIDPVPWEATTAHHHASGANMGMRIRTYRRLGGFRPVSRAEDALLVDDASRAGLRVRRDAASVVVTSDRRRGRVPQGFAKTLYDLETEGLAEIEVAHPVDQVWQYRAHSVARRCYEKSLFDPLTEMIGLSADHLLGVARDCPNSEAFAMRVVPVPPTGMREIGFPAAEAFLATLIASSSNACAA